MTIRQLLELNLTKKGLWPEEAKAVVAEMESTEEAMKGRWDEDSAAYPGVLMDVLRVSANATALKWIDTNHPKHFARLMFA